MLTVIVISHDLREENRLLLIEVFRRLINPQNDGHLDQLWVAIYYLSGFAVIPHF